jgi:hypothetical protein
MIEKLVSFPVTIIVLVSLNNIDKIIPPPSPFLKDVQCRWVVL